MKLAVYGTVQGVGFRYHVRRAARTVDAAGYVRNRPDGSVELEAEGTPNALQHIRHTVEHGPPGAAVQRVDDLPITDLQLDLPFTIRH